MKAIIYKRREGISAEVYGKFNTKKEAKEVLIKKWESIVQSDDNLTSFDGLFLNSTVLNYDVYKWFIEQDMSL